MKDTAEIPKSIASASLKRSSALFESLLNAWVSTQAFEGKSSLSWHPVKMFKLYNPAIIFGKSGSMAIRPIPTSNHHSHRR